MSELKAFRIIQGDTGGCGAPSYKCDTNGNLIEEWSDYREVYDKSEADKVIAELKADYQEACDRLQTANLIKDEQLAETRHQKYKRCLRNAEGCKNKAWFYGEVHDRNAALTMWKWRKRWLELAEKFKDKEA